MTKRRTRGQGEGSIYQRASDGRWVAVVDLGWAGGKRSRKYLYAKTRREVADKLNDALRKQEQGLPVKVERQTVAQFLERWLADVIAPTRRPGTLRSYEQNVRVHIVPAIGRRRLEALTPQDVQRMVAGCLAAGLAPQTAKQVLAALRLALGQAERWGLVARNVATLVDAPRVPRFQANPLPPEDARRLLVAVQGDRLEALYLVSLHLGLRQGESLALRWRDVDLDGATITVRHSLQRANGGRQLVEPKTERSRRTVDLAPGVVAGLVAHRERQHTDRLLVGDRWQEGDFVFTTTVGTPLQERTLGRHLDATLERLGLAPRRWHDLRHTCATVMLSEGIPERIIMEILGHSRLDMTRLYSHVLPPTRRTAAERMERALGAFGGAM